MLVVSYQATKSHNSEDQYMNNRVDHSTTYCKINQDYEGELMKMQVSACYWMKICFRSK